MTTWRTGSHQPQNLYEGDRYAGVMFSPNDAVRVVQAMNAGQPASEVPEPRTDHTPVSIAQEVQAALVDADLDIRQVYLDVVCSSYPRVSVLSAGQNYTTEESDRLALYLAPDAVYREQGQPEKRIGTLEGRSLTGLGVVIHCQPRMTPEEIAAAVSGR